MCIFLFYHLVWLLFCNYLWKGTLCFSILRISQGLHRVHRYARQSLSTLTNGRNQWCVGKCLMTRSLRTKALICSVCYFPRCAYSHHGQCQVAKVTSGTHCWEEVCGWSPWACGSRVQHPASSNLPCFPCLLTERASWIGDHLAKFISEASCPINITVCVDSKVQVSLAFL